MELRPNLNRPTTIEEWQASINSLVLLIGFFPRKSEAYTSTKRLLDNAIAERDILIRAQEFNH